MRENSMLNNAAPGKDGATVEVVHLKPEDEEAYERFLLSSPKTLIYATPEYWRFLREAVGGEPRCLLAHVGDDILGALPYFAKTSPEFGVVINSLPWYGSYGGVVLGGEEDDEARAALLQAFSKIADAPEVFTATLIQSVLESGHEQVYGQIMDPDFTDSRIGQITELPERGEELERRLLEALGQKTRNLVRKSLKQGFRMVETDDERAWRFLSKTHEEGILAKGGRPKPWEHFMAVKKNIPPHMRSLSIAFLEDEPVAALLLMKFNKTVEYITPVIVKKWRSSQPLSFLIYSNMINAARKGYRWWNWGGTWLEQESLRHFKSGWGASETPYRYFVKVDAAASRIIARRRDDLMKAYPYYYVFPFKHISAGA